MRECPPPRVHGAFLTWIPAVRTVRHVCGDNAQPAAVSCLYRAFKRIHDVHCWLLFRPSGTLGGVVPPAHPPASVMPAWIFFLLKLRMRIWLPIHPGEANPPFPTTEKTTGGGVRPRHLISLPRRLRTSAPYILLCHVLFDWVRAFFAFARQRVANWSGLDENVVVGREIGGNGAAISELAIN